MTKPVCTMQEIGNITLTKIEVYAVETYTHMTRTSIHYYTVLWYR